jgi:RimJ/RimL family protein N-acetyltransferase
MTTIRTDRLVLRPPVAGDAASLVRGLNNLEVSRWTARIPHPYGLADAEEYLVLCITAPPEKLRLAITRDGDLIGVIGVEDGEIGYWIAEPEWGKGYATEAAQAMCAHAFGAMALDAMKARYALGNTASRRILLGLGFVETGKTKSFSRATNTETTVMTLTLSLRDWRQGKERRR